MTRGFFLFILAALAAFPALAAPYEFTPDACPIQITLSEAPQISQNCDENKKCTEIARYVHVFAHDSRLNVQVSCSKEDSGIKAQHTLPTMEKTLKALLVDKDVTEYKVGSADRGFANQADLIGMGKKGEFDLVRVGKLWIGDGWIFTVNADLIGSANKDADAMFQTILDSIKQQDKTGAQPNDNNSAASAPAKRH